jgi:hypothetical protein
MTILLAELKAWHGETVNDTSANGGRRGSTEIVSGAVQNVFPHVFRSERVAGVTRYRKVFYSVDNDADETAYNGTPFFHHPPSGGDHYLWWHVGDQADTQTDITGSERRYGSAFLSIAATAGSSTLVVDCTDSDQTGIFVDGDPIMVSDKVTPDASTNNEELHDISGTPVVSGTQVTITIAGTLANSYAVDVTSVSSGINVGDIGCDVDSWAESFAGDGAFDEATYPVECDNIGTVYDTFTLTFDGSGNVVVTGAAEGSLGTFSLASDVAPTNAGRSSKPYWTLRVAGLSGTPVANDTIVFRTLPAEIAIWETLTVPADADPIGNGGFYSYLDCETA